MELKKAKSIILEYMKIKKNGFKLTDKSDKLVDRAILTILKSPKNTI